MTDERDIYKISLSEKSSKIISESIDFYFTSLELFDDSTLIFGVDGRIVFWNINDEKEISSINAHGDDIHYLDHFENYFVSVSQNCCKVWDMNTKSQELLIYGYCEEITSVFMYDEELIVIGMENGAIAVYSTTEKKLINNCFNHSGRVDYIDCLNGIYATGCSDGVVVTGDLKTNQSHTYNNPYSYVKDVKLSNTHVFCVAGDDIAFWKLESNDLPVLFSNGYDSTSKIILYSEGQFLASGSSYGTVRFWKIEDQSQLKILNEQPEISALALSEDENFLFAGSSTGFIGVYSTISRDFMCKLEGHSVFDI
jgi:WD40 repeat protein